MNNVNSMFGNSGSRPARSATGGFGGGSRGGGKGDIIPKGYRAGQMQQFTPEQLDLFQSLFSQLSPDSNLFKMASGDQSFFDEMERPALRDFGALQGNIASRFSGQGMGARRSSGFQNTMNKEGSDFAQRLQANRQNLSRQALQDLFQMSNLLMNERPYDRYLVEKPQKQEGGSGWGSLIGGAAGGIGGAFLGQPLLGAQLGAAAGSYF
jgi:hypothetical protein